MYKPIKSIYYYKIQSSNVISSSTYNMLQLNSMDESSSGLRGSVPMMINLLPYNNGVAITCLYINIGENAYSKLYGRYPINLLSYLILSHCKLEARKRPKECSAKELVYQYLYSMCLGRNVTFLEYLGI